MIVTTGPGVEGRPVERYLGVVSSQAIMGIHLGKDITAGFRNIVGGRSKSYEKEIAQAVGEVIEELGGKAEELGADAIVSIDIDYESVGGSMLMVAGERHRREARLSHGRAVARAGAPAEASALGEPAARSAVGERSLTLSAGPRTDWFVPPDGSGPPVMNAPAFVGDAQGDYVLGARVAVDFAATYDAGVLALHAGDTLWAKLCFERSPEGTPMVVSVVTREVSDDCNSFAVDGRQVWLRIARRGARVRLPRLVRRMRLGADSPFRARESGQPGRRVLGPVADGRRLHGDVRGDLVSPGTPEGHQKRRVGRTGRETFGAGLDSRLRELETLVTSEEVGLR